MDSQILEFLWTIEKRSNIDTQTRKEADRTIDDFKNNQSNDYIRMMTSLFSAESVAALLPVRANAQSGRTELGKLECSPTAQQNNLVPQILFVAASDLWSFVHMYWSDKTFVQKEVRMGLMNTLLNTLCYGVAIQKTDNALFNKLSVTAGIAIARDGALSIYTDDFVNCINNVSQPSVAPPQQGGYSVPVGPNDMRLQALRVYQDALTCKSAQFSKFGPLSRNLVGGVYDWLSSAAQADPVDYPLFRAVAKVQQRLMCVLGTFHMPTLQGCVSIFGAKWFNALQQAGGSAGGYNPGVRRSDSTYSFSDERDAVEERDTSIFSVAEETLRTISCGVQHHKSSLREQASPDFYKELFNVLLQLMSQPPTEGLANLSLRIMAEVVKSTDDDPGAAQSLGQLMNSAQTGGNTTLLESLLRGIITTYLQDIDMDDWHDDPETCVLASELSGTRDESEELTTPEVEAEELLLSLTMFGGTNVVALAWKVIGDFIQAANTDTEEGRKLLTAALHAFGLCYRTLGDQGGDLEARGNYCNFFTNTLIPSLNVGQDSNSGAPSLVTHPLILRRVIWVMGMWCENLPTVTDIENDDTEGKQLQQYAHLRGVAFNSLFEVLRVLQQSSGGVTVVLALQTLKVFGNMFATGFDADEFTPEQYASYMNAVGQILPKLSDPEQVTDVCNDVHCLMGFAGKVFNQGTVAQEMVAMFTPVLDMYVSGFKVLDGNDESGSGGNASGGNQQIADTRDDAHHKKKGQAAAAVLGALTATLFHSRGTDDGRWEVVPYALYIIDSRSFIYLWAHSEGWDLVKALVYSALGTHQHFTPQLLHQLMTHTDLDFEEADCLLSALGGLVLLAVASGNTESVAGIIPQLCNFGTKYLLMDPETDSFGTFGRAAFELLDILTLTHFDTVAPLIWEAVGGGVASADPDRDVMLYRCVLATRILVMSGDNLKSVYTSALPSREQQSSFLERLALACDDTESSYPKVLCILLFRRLMNDQSLGIGIPDDCQDLVSHMLDEAELLGLADVNQQVSWIERYATLVESKLEWQTPDEHIAGTSAPGDAHGVRLNQLLSQFHS